MKKYDYLIVGAGISGATIARLLTDHHKKVLVIEEREQVGGNIATKLIDDIPVHLYGPHIFHTSFDDVWEFVNKYCTMLPFINTPLANYHGEIYHLPFNMNTFHELWGVNTKEEAQAKIFEEVQKEHIKEPKNLEEQALSMVGRTIYTKLIKEYTEKQWGRDCKELPAFIIKRLPLRFEYNNNYFNDLYQGIPQGGFSVLVENLLKGIEVRTSTNYFKHKEELDSLCEKVIFTGRIDEFFGFKYGALEYRSLRFEHELLPVDDYQHNAVINYTSHDVSYTRITEHKHFDSTVKNHHSTYISKEYPDTFEEGKIPYYTVNDEKNNSLCLRYEEEAKKCKNVYFLGRLARYKYYDMDDAIKEAFVLFESLK